MNTETTTKNTEPTSYDVVICAESAFFTTDAVEVVPVVAASDRGLEFFGCYFAPGTANATLAANRVDAFIETCVALGLGVTV